MTEVKWQISCRRFVFSSDSPDDRAVVVLLRHSVSDNLPERDAATSSPSRTSGASARSSWVVFYVAGCALAMQARWSATSRPRRRAR